MRYRDLLTDLVSKYGQGTLAEKVGTDDSTLSRFRSEQGSLPLKVIEAIAAEAQAIIIPVEEFERLKDALALMSEMWVRERHNKGFEDKEG